MERKTIFWLLIIITFIILVIIWQFSLKISPKKEEKDFKEIFNLEIEEDIKKIFQEIKNLNLSRIFTESNTEYETREELTNEEIERFKNKVLEYVNR